MSTDPLDDYIDAVSKALGLSIADAWKPAVRANLRYRCGLQSWWMNSHYPMKPSRPVSLQPDIALTANGSWLSAHEIARAVTAQRIQPSASRRRRWRASPDTIRS